MMVSFLSGGTGTPKLLRGYSSICPEFNVIVNVAEDVWVSGNKVCPDIDSVIYAIADIIDDKKWWGIKNDSFVTHRRLKMLGFDEKMMIGDLDRATHIIRSELLRKGYSLTDATREIKNMFGVKAEVLPVCNEEISTYIKTCDGWLHFQEFWVCSKGEPEVLDVEFRGIEKAKLTNDVKFAIKNSDAVVIGPSNPITSITPIIEIENMRMLLKSKFVLAISPIIGNKPVSGPAGKLMRAFGLEVSANGVANYYSDFLDLIIVHSGDTCEFEHIETNILMKCKEDEVRLAKFLINTLREYIG